MSGHQEYECDKDHRWESLGAGSKCPICFPDKPKIDDGGPAFPIPKSDLTGSYAAAPGMSLRDWFAGMALQGLCSANTQHLLSEKFKDTASEDELAALIDAAIAQACYFYADTMLAARTIVNQSKQIKYEH